MAFVFDPTPVASLPVHGINARFPVHRIYAIGRNYAAHAKEMGSENVSRANPVFFMKPADALVPGGGEIPYPPATHDFHHEVEMVVALGCGGCDVDPARALDLVFGYGVGVDLTRRDLQAAMKAAGSPWDIAKGFDASAPVSELRASGETGHPAHARLTLDVNGERRQDANVSEMIFSVAETIAGLSRLFELKPGDLVFTGTPAGVGPLARGDRFRAELSGIAVMEGRIV